MNAMNRYPALLIVLTIAFLTGCGDEPETSPTPATEHAEEMVTLPLEVLQDYGVVLDTARAGTITVTVALPGEIKVNEDRLVHVVPRVPGIVQQDFYTVGDRVQQGARMALLESRELAELQGAYLAALERYKLARANAEREARLFRQNIASEQEYLEAQQQLAEATIELQIARQKLLALGFSQAYVDSLPQLPEEQLARYELRAPLSGIVVDRHLALGEALEANDVAFTIADLRTVWIDLSVYPRDLPRIQAGQPVTIQLGHGLPVIKTRIRFVRPILGEETRTAIARAVVRNPEGLYKPGTFVTGQIEVGSIQADIVVPKTAILYMNEQPVVFVYTGEGFKPVPVTIGLENDTLVQLTGGLRPGDVYVRKGGFVLRAELEKSEMEEGHGH